MSSNSLTRKILFFFVIFLLLSTTSFVLAAIPSPNQHLPSSFESSTFEMERLTTRTKPENRAARYRIAVQRQSHSQEQIPISNHVVSVAAKEKTMITTRTKTRTTHTSAATVAVKPNPKNRGSASDLIKQVLDLKEEARILSGEVGKISSAAKNLLELQKEVKNKMALHSSAMNTHLSTLTGLIRDIEKAIDDPGLKSRLAAMSSVLSASQTSSSSAGAEDGNGGKPDPKIAQNIASLMQLLLANVESMAGLEEKMMKILGVVEVINSELTSLNEYLVEIGPKIQMFIKD